jgi:murein DD-endopeptidase MepM/ murein hydrolase activator NlpD
MTLPYQPLRMAAQRLNILLHPKTAVKKLSIAALLLVVFLILGSVTGISATAGRIADKFILYVHVARLYTKEPDLTIAMPIQDVSKKQIADTWHAPRGSDRLHEGQDIFAPQGTPVLSATEGYIVNIGENNLGGQTVSVVGAGGRSYYYAHLDSYAPHIAEGDYVTKQTVLGYVGTTGNASGTPPHLHFGVYAPGGAMNPLPLLSDRAPSTKKAPDAKSKKVSKKRVTSESRR